MIHIMVSSKGRNSHSLKMSMDVKVKYLML